jgi:hypothetical protein
VTLAEAGPELTAVAELLNIPSSLAERDGCGAHAASVSRSVSSVATAPIPNQVRATL